MNFRYSQGYFARFVPLLFLKDILLDLYHCYLLSMFRRFCDVVCDLLFGRLMYRL
jgi:hypothetical protein